MRYPGVDVDLTEQGKQGNLIGGVEIMDTRIHVPPGISFYKKFLM